MAHIISAISYFAELKEIEVDKNALAKVQLYQPTV
jgi:hypothetical protein